MAALSWTTFWTTLQNRAMVRLDGADFRGMDILLTGVQFVRFTNKLGQGKQETMLFEK